MNYVSYSGIANSRVLEKLTVNKLVIFSSFFRIWKLINIFANSRNRATYYIYVYTHTCVCVCVCVCIYIYIYIYIRTYVRMYIWFLHLPPIYISFDSILSHTRRSSKKSCSFGFLPNFSTNLPPPWVLRTWSNHLILRLSQRAGKVQIICCSEGEFTLRCEIWGSSSDLDDDSSLLGYDTVTFGK